MKNRYLTLLLAAMALLCPVQAMEFVSMGCVDTLVTRYSPQDAIDTLAFRACFAEVAPLMDIHRVSKFYAKFDAVVSKQSTFSNYSSIGYVRSRFEPDIDYSWFLMNPQVYGSPKLYMGMVPSGEYINAAPVRYLKGITGVDRSELFYEYKYNKPRRSKDSIEADKQRLIAALARYDTLATSKPLFYTTIHERFAGDCVAYVEAIYSTSIFTSVKRLKKYLRHPTKEALQADLGVQHEIGMALYEAYIEKVRHAGCTSE